MFNIEELSIFPKMQEYSAVDGFMEISECMAEMIKFASNEPSVGLFYIQQHTRNAVPNLVNIKNNVTEKTHEMKLHTEDFEDSITMMRSMKECGFPIIDEMTKDIKRSLSIMSTKEPKRGLISSSVTAPGYFPSVFRSAKEKASNFKWPLVDSAAIAEVEGELSDVAVEVLGDEGSSLSLTGNYQEFAADREAKLEEWLGGRNDEDEARS